MKEQYQKLEESIQDVYNIYKEMASIMSGPKMEAYKRKIEKGFVTVDYRLKKLEEYVPKVDPIEVQNEWGGEEFYQAWNFYKDYLKEQHNKALASRTELKLIKFIKDISDGDVSLAIKYLDFLVATAAKTPLNIPKSEFIIKRDQEDESDRKQTQKDVLRIPFKIQ